MIHAQEAASPSTIAGAYSPYEEETIREAEDLLGTTRDPHPEGKTIESVEAVPLDVFEKRDPLPGWAADIANVFHATTRPWVIEDQMLVHEGQRYDKVLLDETARNLTGVAQLSVVICTAMRGHAPDKVRAVCITKDVWSLRLNWNLGYTKGGLESLSAVPSETNLLGTHQTILGRYSYTPKASSIGAGYRLPRVAGTWVYLTADASVIINHSTGHAEGSFGSVTAEQPLYSTLTEWAWSSGVGWNQQIFRRYQDASELGFETKDANGNTVLLPYEYSSRALTATGGVTRSFGWAVKNDVSIGAEMSVRTYRNTDAMNRFDPVAVRSFDASEVPLSDTRVGPYVQWRHYETTFLRTFDVETLGLQEDFRLGPDVFARVYPVTNALGSSRTFLGTYGAAQYTFRLGDGFARASVEATTEAESDRVSDAALGANLRVVSPRTPIGRFVYDAAVLDRWRNYINRQTFLGGDSRLRGYATNAFHGADAAVMNFEFRTRSFELLATEIGGVAFFDAGGAASSLDRVRAKSSVGFGLRWLFPQFDRIPMRADVGFPVAPVPGGYSFFISFGQAFPIESVGNSVATGGINNAATLGGALGQ